MAQIEWPGRPHLTHPCPKWSELVSPACHFIGAFPSMLWVPVPLNLQSSWGSPLASGCCSRLGGSLFQLVGLSCFLCCLFSFQGCALSLVTLSKEICPLCCTAYCFENCSWMNNGVVTLSFLLTPCPSESPSEAAQFLVFFCFGWYLKQLLVLYNSS